ncbi:MAG TPA: VOC family protein [Solirubrobacteraceae bacterium]|jgi:catechol 2,3-dioxygenase-like lactoylglutathione lyase family enzyme
MPSPRFSFQHVGVVAADVARLERFYTDVIGLEPIATPAAQSAEMMGFSWLRLGEHELHVIERSPDFAQRMGVSINPSLQPHFAVRIDDIEALKRRLTAAGVEWIDWSRIGISGLNQIFVRDPEGNVVEFEQF